jgi:hypothetical protein
MKMEIMRLNVGSKNEGMQGVLLSHDIDPGQLQDYHDLVPGQFQEHILLSLLYCFLGRDKLLLRDPGLNTNKVMVFITSS